MNLSKGNLVYFLLITIFLISGCGAGSTGSNAEESSVNKTSQKVTTTATATTTTATTMPTEPAAAPPITTATPTTSTPVTIKPYNKATHSGQVKDSKTEKGLANVKISIGSVSTTTDADGYYSFSDLTENEEAVVNFEKEGYLMGSSHIQLKSLSADNTHSSNYLEYRMHAYSDAWKNGRKWSYRSQNGASGGAVLIPANSTRIKSNGNIYNGTVYARWVLMDVSTKEGRNSFPGVFKGINSNGVTVPFVSYALTVVELRDTEGNTLDVSEDITLILDSITGTSADIIPLWYYDYDQGLWVEEGYAQRQTNGSYRADITHTGTWSLSQPLDEEVGIYRGYIINEDGLPLKNVRLKAIGANWISSDLSTDENGLFQIEVIPGSSFQLEAYDYNAKFAATYPNTITAISADEVIEN